MLKSAGTHAPTRTSSALVCLLFDFLFSRRFFFREIKTWLKVELIFVKIKPCRFFVLKPAKQDMILDRFLKKRSLKFLDKMTNIGGIKKMTGEEINQQFFFFIK